jgi:hypothetical protein
MDAIKKTNRSQCHIRRNAECFCRKGDEAEEEVVSMRISFVSEQG